MPKLKDLLKTCLFTALVSTLFGCHSDNHSNTVKVGVIAGPEAQLMEVAKREAARTSGLEIEIVTFHDYNHPNAELADGKIDANMFQHLPFLEAAIKAHDYKLVSIAETYVFPMGLYSKKHKELIDVPAGGIVGIPSDPSNGARALLLLEKAGLIDLKPGVTIYATLADIANNPRKLRFKEFNAAQLTHVLPDLDLAAINTNYAMLAALHPSHNALAKEDAQSPYANVVVVRQADKDNPKFKNLVAALHSEAVQNEAKILFKNEAIPAWK